LPSIPGLSDAFSSARTSPMQNLDDLIIPLQTVCIPNISVSTGQTTQGVDANLGPIENPARLYGAIVPESYTPGNYVSVVLNPIGGECSGSSRFADVDTSNGAYEITNIEPGDYSVIAYEFDDESNLVEKNDEDMQVNFAPGETKELNIPLKLLVPITLIAPADYQRLPLSDLTFEWSVPSETPSLNYILMIMNRCGDLAYHQENIQYNQEGNTIQTKVQSQDFLNAFSEPEKTIFTWYLTGIRSDGSIAADMHYSIYSNTHFLIDP
ncbi:MAG: hypothetical protein ACP5I1_14400, partial [Candidatus Hinthialibacter sp.]